MIYFGDVFPDVDPIFSMHINKKGDQITQGTESLSDGEYIGFEHYCDNVFCKCTTVVLDILYVHLNHPENNKSVASISYDWKKIISQKNPCFYDKDAQSDIAKNILNIFRSALKRDYTFATKFNAHFEMVKTHIKGSAE